MVRDSALEQSAQAEPHKAFGRDCDLVKEARKEFFSKHSYNFVTEGTHNLLEIFR